MVIEIRIFSIVMLIIQIYTYTMTEAICTSTTQQQPSLFPLLLAAKVGRADQRTHYKILPYQVFKCI